MVATRSASSVDGLEDTTIVINHPQLLRKASCGCRFADEANLDRSLEQLGGDARRIAKPLVRVRSWIVLGARPIADPSRKQNRSRAANKLGPEFAGTDHATRDACIAGSQRSDVRARRTSIPSSNIASS